MTANGASVEDVEPQIVDVTITAPDADWLCQHCAIPIEKRLATSANIIPAVDSIYRWQGQVHHATEAYAIVHTRLDCFGEIVRLTNEDHPYETVHVVAHQSDRSDEDYRLWVLQGSVSTGAIAPTEGSS